MAVFCLNVPTLCMYVYGISSGFDMPNNTIQYASAVELGAVNLLLVFIRDLPMLQGFRRKLQLEHNCTRIEI